MFTAPFLILLSTIIPIGEVPVSSPVYSNAPGEQVDAHVASDGDRFFAVWRDQREGSENLYAARFDANGNLLDPTDIRIPLPHGDGRAINAVFSERGVWTIVWSEQDYRADTPVPKSNVMIARIDRDGHVIDGPRALLDNAYASAWRAAATNGSRILVFYDRKYALLDENGTVLRRDVVLATDISANSGIVASSGSDFVIAMPRVAVVVNANGDITSVIAATTLREVPMGLASNGSSYLLVTRNFDTQEFSTRRIGGAQAQSAPAVLPAIPGIPTSGDLTWTGSSYVLEVVSTIESAAGTYQQAFGVRIDASGNPIDSQPFALSDRVIGSATVFATIATDGGRLATTWSATAPTSQNDVYASVTDAASLQRSDAVLLSRSANLQVNPSIATNGSGFLTLWQQTTGTYFASEGDGRGVQLSPAAYNPKVIFDGANYIAAWITEGPTLGILWATRITPDGQRLDGGGIPVASSTCVFNFDLAASGDHTLVVYDDCGFKALHAIQLDRRAQPIGTAVTITPDSMRTAKPAVAWNGSEYLVAFQEQISIPFICLAPVPCETFRSNIRAVRLSPDLIVRDTEPLAIAVSDTEDQHSPVLASNGGDFLVGWTSNEMRTRHVSADGSLSATRSFGAGALSSVIWDGSRYAAAFAANGDVFLTHPDAGDIQIISATADVESSPMLVPGIAAYVRTATETLYGGVPRVFLRSLQETRRSRVVRAR